MYPITKVTDIDLAFPANVSHLMPTFDELSALQRDPEHQRLQKVASRLFFEGGDVSKWSTKEGIERLDALRQIQCVLRSYEPKHEHKIAAVAFLIGEWFDGVE